MNNWVIESTTMAVYHHQNWVIQLSGLKMLFSFLPENAHSSAGRVWGTNLSDTSSIIPWMALIQGDPLKQHTINWDQGNLFKGLIVAENNGQNWGLRLCRLRKICRKCQSFIAAGTLTPQWDRKTEIKESNIEWNEIELGGGGVLQLSHLFQGTITIKRKNYLAFFFFLRQLECADSDWHIWPV